MASVYSENLRVYNAQQFKLSLVDPDPTNIYLTFGRVAPWANDLAPPQANSSVDTFNSVWANMIAAKQISGNDVRHAIPRYDWVANTSFVAYDHCLSQDLYAPNTKFYVLTSDWNVYKCLSNNNGGLSTVMPTQIQTNISIEEADGYIWKYMYTLTNEERIRFMTDSYIPVQTLDRDNNSLQWRVQDDAIDGAIEAITITNGGSGYSNANSVIVQITGNGTAAEAIARVNTTSQTVTSIVMTNKGYGYTNAIVSITDSNGSGANARAIISPTGGHGKDPLRELGGSYLILNPRIKSNEDGLIPVQNDFREIAIIQDPVEATTGNTASGRVYSQVMIVTVTSGSEDYDLDETVYQGGSLATATFTGVVTNWDATNQQLMLTNTVGTPTFNPLVGNNSTTSRYVDSITDKDLVDRSGHLLYVDYIQPITRSIDQTEDYKIVLKF